MIVRFFHRWSAGRMHLALTVLTICTAMTVGAIAQVIPGEEQSPDETLQVWTGGVFEILADTEDQDALVSWVLTRDREFIEAGSKKIFAVRLTEPGQYLLESAAAFPQQNRRVRKNITLVVTENGAPQAGIPGDTRIVTSDPVMIGQRVTLNPTRTIVTLQPTETASTDVRLDLNTAIDTDNNGNPADDNDTIDAHFAHERNALHLWYVDLPASRELRVSSGVNQQTIQITMGTAIPVAPAPPAPVIGQIVATESDNGLVSFRYDIAASPSDSLHQWNFGDGTQSLQTAPVHQYRANGLYDVEVIVRSLRTGAEVSKAAQSFTITTVNNTASSSAEPTPDPEPEQPTEPTTPSSGGSIFWLILSILGVGLLAVLLGAGAMWLFSKVRKGGLQKGIADAEAKLMSKDGAKKSAIDVPPPPLELKREETPAPAPEPEPEPAPEPAPIATPESIPADAPAPAWLQQGLAVANNEPAPPVTPAPEPLPPPPVPEVIPPAPAPSPEPASEANITPLPTEQELLPPWMQDIPAPAAPELLPAEPVTQTPSTPPAPPVSEPVTPPIAPVAPEQPAPAPEAVPPWLQQASAEPTPAPMPVETPAPMQPDPTPAPAPVVEPVPPMPEPLPPAAPVAPEPAPITPTPTPAPEPVPAPVPTTPVATTPAPQAPVATMTDADKERAERERERKRRKRQRYRENLKKRKDTDAPVQVPAPSVTPPAPVAESPTASQTAAKTPTPNAPESPVATTPAPAVETPTAPAAPERTPKNDDSVAFMIRAESIDPKDQPKP